MAKRKNIVSKAKEALNKMKEEISDELGISKNESDTNVHLTSRQTGKKGGAIGGNMTKRLVDMAKEKLSKK